ncbi:DUF4920 domain-containing protein [Pseudoxanthomonas putridarboris]|uniref:DUF4920 domain-containing protein n=1 Tax=Pseudoxanthomonas putridarboris TaxID=752605 RepID=A0ABU9IVC0_9GAMM
MRRWLMAACLLAGVATVYAADAPAWEKFGADVPAGEAVPVSRALDDAAAHEGQPRKFSGRITDVCQKKGCWVMLEDDGRSARVLLGDHDFYVPRDVRGQAEVYGVLSRVALSPAARDHMAKEAAAGAAVPEVEYRIVAEGVQVLADDPGA